MVAAMTGEARAARGQWVLLSYRLPREPSTPRVEVWRALKRLGAAQLLDGLVALPQDNRTLERLEWLADRVRQAGGDADVWLATPATAGQERALAARMRASVAGEYRALADEAREALSSDGAVRRRALRRLRRQMQLLRRRDYFPPPERDVAREALGRLAEATEVVEQ